MNMNVPNNKVKTVAIKSLLNEKEEHGKFVPLQGENKLYC